MSGNKIGKESGNQPNPTIPKHRKKKKKKKPNVSSRAIQQENENRETWKGEKKCRLIVVPQETRPDTRLPKSRAGGQGPYLRSLDHLGRNSEAKDRKNPKK